MHSILLSIRTSLLSSTLGLQPYLSTRSLRMGRWPLAAAYHNAPFPLYTHTTQGNKRHKEKGDGEGGKDMETDNITIWIWNIATLTWSLNTHHRNIPCTMLGRIISREHGTRVRMFHCAQLFQIIVKCFGSCMCHASTCLVLVCGRTVVSVNENLQELSVPTLAGKEDCRGAWLQSAWRRLYDKVQLLAGIHAVHV